MKNRPQIKRNMLMPWVRSKFCKYPDISLLALPAFSFSLAWAPRNCHRRRGWRQDCRQASSIELFEIAIDAPLTERNAPRRCQISGYPRPSRDPVMQRDETGNLPFEALHAPGEGVAQPFDALKQRQVDIAEAPTKDESAAVLCQNPFEIAEIFRHAVAPEILASPPCRRALLFEIEPARDRMMRVVDLVDEVRDGKLQLMGPQACGFAARGEIQAWTEKQQHVRRLRDDGLAGLEKWRRIGRTSLPAIRHELHHRSHAGLAAARHIDVIGAGFF